MNILKSLDDRHTDKYKQKEDEMNIFDLTDFNKPEELLQYLFDNKIYYESGYNRVKFYVEYFDTSFIGYGYWNEQELFLINLYMDGGNYTFEEQARRLLVIKDKMSKIHEAEFDNTNNLDIDNISVTFVFKKKYVKVIGKYCKETGGYEALIQVCVKDLKAVGDEMRKSRLPVEFILKVTAFINGACVLLYYLLQDYMFNKKLFWCAFGLTVSFYFAFIFCIVFEKILIFRRKHLRLDVLHVDRIKKVFFLEETRKTYPARCYYELNNKETFIRHNPEEAILRIEGDKVVLYTIVDNLPLKLNTPLKEAYIQFLTGRVLFEHNDRTYQAEIVDELAIRLIDYGFHARLINSADYDPLFEELRLQTVRINPYSVFKTHHIGYLDFQIGAIVKILLLNPDISERELYNVMRKIFKNDIYYETLMFDKYMKTIREYRTDKKAFIESSTYSIQPKTIVLSTSFDDEDFKYERENFYEYT